jgi:hypothetical protein
MIYYFRNNLLCVDTNDNVIRLIYSGDVVFTKVGTELNNVDAD